MLRTTRAALVWWLMFCCQVAATLVGTLVYDIHHLILKSDSTNITWLILGIYLMSTVFVGWKTLRDDPDNLAPIEYVADNVLVGLGIIGTLTGFILLLTTVFSNVDVGSADSLKTAIANMSSRMGTAVWTTLSGIACGLLLKGQIINLQQLEE